MRKKRRPRAKDEVIFFLNFEQFINKGSFRKLNRRLNFLKLEKINIWKEKISKDSHGNE